MPTTIDHPAWCSHHDPGEPEQNEPGWHCGRVDITPDLLVQLHEANRVGVPEICVDGHADSLTAEQVTAMVTALMEFAAIVREVRSDDVDPILEKTLDVLRRYEMREYARGYREREMEVRDGLPVDETLMDRADEDVSAEVTI